MKLAFGRSGTRYRPRSSVTSILTNLVGRSVVSAITQTPASGPFVLVTTPPISSLSMRTTVSCWLLSWRGHEAKKAAIPTATIPKDNSLLVFMTCSFRRFHFDIGDPHRCDGTLAARSKTSRTLYSHDDSELGFSRTGPSTRGQNLSHALLSMFWAKADTVEA